MEPSSEGYEKPLRIKQMELTSNLPIKIEGLNKEAIDSLAARMISEVVAGNEDPGELYIKLDFLKKSIEKGIKSIKEGAVDELTKYDRGQKFMGVEVSVTNRPSYKYDHYQGWNDKKEELKKIESLMKAAMDSNHNIADSDGEIVPPAIVTYSDTITPKYPKE